MRCKFEGNLKTLNVIKSSDSRGKETSQEAPRAPDQLSRTMNKGDTETRKPETQGRDDTDRKHHLQPHKQDVTIKIAWRD